MNINSTIAILLQQTRTQFFFHRHSKKHFNLRPHQLLDNIYTRIVETNTHTVRIFLLHLNFHGAHKRILMQRAGNKNKSVYYFVSYVDECVISSLATTRMGNNIGFTSNRVNGHWIVAASPHRPRKDPQVYNFQQTPLFSS